MTATTNRFNKISKFAISFMVLVCASLASACTSKLDYGKGTVYYNDGTVLYLGRFPRSEVDADLAATLENLYNNGSLAADGEYYSYEANEYCRKVVTNDYVDEDTDDAHFELFTQYKVGSVHWYKVEPVKWRLLNVQKSYAVLLSDELIYAMAYGNAETEKSWLWENSDLRNWLNGYFYNTAFSADEQKLLSLTESPCYYISNPGRIKYERESVKDYIRVPEWREIRLPELFPDDLSRIAQVTDYARACGGACVSANAIVAYDKPVSEYEQYIGSGIYWLSDTEYNTNHVYITYEFGNTISYKYTVKNRTVRPVLTVKYNSIKTKIAA